MPPYDSNELHLVRRIAAGDELAFQEVVDSHVTGVHDLALRILRRHEEAEEVTQETFLKLWQKADEFESKAKLRTWLYTMTRHAAIDRLRQRRESFTDEMDDEPSSERPSTLLSAKRDAEAVQAALDCLAPRQRAAIALVHYQGLSGAEAADSLGVGIEALESLLSRARRKLRTLLQRLRPSSSDTTASTDSSHD